MNEPKDVSISVVIVDATKLNKLARFYHRNTGDIIRYFQKLKADGKLLLSVEMTVDRAWQSFKRKEPFQSKNEELEIRRLYYGKVQILLDEIVPLQKYQSFISDTDQVLQDWQKEDAHVLACAIAYSSCLGVRTSIWTDDNDFISKANLIDNKFGIKVIQLV